MALDVLGGDWFSDSPLDLANKDARISASSTWIIELGELAALGQRGLEGHKAYLAGRRDKVRPPYGRADERFNRHCVFGGTTNVESFLIDSTGNRRYWVAEVLAEIDVDGLRRDRDQLWAEAVHRYRAGERWWFDGSEQVEADKVTEDHREENPWITLIRDWYEANRLTAANSDGAPVGAFKLSDCASHALMIPTHDLVRRAADVAHAPRTPGSSPGCTALVAARGGLGLVERGERRIGWPPLSHNTCVKVES